MWGAVMSAHKFPAFVNPDPSDIRSPQGRIAAPSFKGRKFASRAEDGRFRLLPSLRLASRFMRKKLQESQMEASERDDEKHGSADFSLSSRALAENADLKVGSTKFAALHDVPETKGVNV